MSDPKECRELIREFMNRAQKIYLLLIGFCFVIFVFGVIDFGEIRKTKKAVEHNSQQYQVLINLSQFVVNGIRESLLLHYADTAPSEEARIFGLISDIERARRIVAGVRKRILQTAAERPDILPAESESRPSLVQLNPVLNFLEDTLYFRVLILAEPAIGTLEWDGGLQDHPLDDLTRFGYVVSVNPRRIVDSLAGYASARFHDPSEVSDLAAILGHLRNDANEQSKESLRSTAVRLWKEWLQYKDSSRFRAAQVQNASLRNLIRLHTETQAELDKLTSWEEGKKGVVLPGVSGEVPLSLSLWSSPFAATAVFLLMTIFVMRARGIAEEPDSRSGLSGLGDIQIPYLPVMKIKGSSLEKKLLNSMRFLALVLPLSVSICIGILNPALRPDQLEIGRVIYWLGVCLAAISTALYARQCARFRAACESILVLPPTSPDEGRGLRVEGPL